MSREAPESLPFAGSTACKRAAGEPQPEHVRLSDGSKSTTDTAQERSPVLCLGKVFYTDQAAFEVFLGYKPFGIGVDSGDLVLNTSVQRSASWSRPAFAQCPSESKRG